MVVFKEYSIIILFPRAEACVKLQQIRLCTRLWTRLWTRLCSNCVLIVVYMAARWGRGCQRASNRPRQCRWGEVCLHLFSGCAECVFFSCRPVQDGYLTGWHKACRFHTLAPPACQIALGFVARLREPAAWLPGSTKQKYFIECVMYLSEQDGR